MQSNVLNMHNAPVATIRRQPLRDQVYAELLRQIISGELAPGAQVVEQLVTGQLNVSRTPLREALFRLEAEGFVRSHPARGFFVAPLSLEEARELYPILWTLESLALKIAGIPGEEILNQLQILADSRASAKRPGRALEFDTMWHEMLIRGCRNGRLQAEVSALRHAVRRYETAYMHAVEEQRAANADHHAIMAALRSNDLPSALRLVEEHWAAGLDSLVERLPAPY